MAASAVAIGLTAVAGRYVAGVYCDRVDEEIDSWVANNPDRARILSEMSLSDLEREVSEGGIGSAERNFIGLVIKIRRQEKNLESQRAEINRILAGNEISD